MFRKWMIPTLAVLALTFMAPLDARAQLGKKGDGDKQEGKSESKEKSDKGGSRSQDSKPSKKDDNKGSTTSKGRLYGVFR